MKLKFTLGLALLLSACQPAVRPNLPGATAPDAANATGAPAAPNVSAPGSPVPPAVPGRLLVWQHVLDDVVGLPGAASVDPGVVTRWEVRPWTVAIGG